MRYVNYKNGSASRPDCKLFFYGFTYVVQDNERLCPTTIGIADGVADSVSNNGRKQLLNEEHQEGCADSRKDKIMY